MRRGGAAVAALDVYDYLLRGDNSADVRLENGDVLFVRTHGPRVRVAGEVVRPATYELKPGETLRDALTAAGGFRATAAWIARLHPVRGWVRNLADGRVELLADGSDQGVEAFLADVRDRMAEHIENGDSFERDCEGRLDGFRVVG